MRGRQCRSAAGRRCLLAAALCLAAGAACENIREYAGTWDGPVSPDPLLRKGFPAGARLHATIGVVTRSDFNMDVVLPGDPAVLPFQPIRGAEGDALGDLRITGDPMRTVLGYLKPASADAFLTVVSIYPDDRIDVRVIRGPDETYGVFRLRRAR